MGGEGKGINIEESSFLPEKDDRKKSIEKEEPACRSSKLFCVLSIHCVSEWNPFTSSLGGIFIQIRHGHSSSDVGPPSPRISKLFYDR